MGALRTTLPMSITGLFATNTSSLVVLSKDGEVHISEPAHAPRLVARFPTVPRPVLSAFNSAAQQLTIVETAAPQRMLTASLVTGAITSNRLFCDSNITALYIGDEQHPFYAWAVSTDKDGPQLSVY